MVLIIGKIVKIVRNVEQPVRFGQGGIDHHVPAREQARAETLLGQREKQEPDRIGAQPFWPIGMSKVGSANRQGSSQRYAAAWMPYSSA